MWREILELWHSVRDPEYTHLLLESLPLYGLALGLVMLIVAVFAGEKKTRLAALAWMGISCISVWPYLDARLSATPRILATRHPSYGPSIQAQTQLRADTAWAYYGMAAFCVSAMALTRSKYARHALMLVIITGVGMFWLSVWLHKKECEVYHPNIRRSSVLR
jgi:hypothetical protein